MKSIHLLFLIASVSLSSAALAGNDHQHGQTQHGGVMVETTSADYELVAKPDVIQLYVTDHGKPIDLKGASAKLTLLTGNEKSEITLAPAGDKLEAKGSFEMAPGTKTVAVVTIPDRAATTARFAIK